MKNATLTQGLFMALLLAGGTAGADTQYPSGFEPAPVFEDEGLAGKYSPPKTPPTAVEQAKPRTEQSRPAAKAEPGRPDAGQPAKQSPTATPPATAGQMEPDAAEITSPKAFDTLPELLVENYPVGLIVLALAGLVFRSARRPECKAQETRNDSAGFSVGTAAETGVARYLKNLDTSAK